MDQKALEQALEDLPLGGIQYYRTIGSTNREALAWAKTGAPDLALVTADEQTAGYGRGGSKWYTPKGEALAFSIILNPPFFMLWDELVYISILTFHMYCVCISL